MFKVKYWTFITSVILFFFNNNNLVLLAANSCANLSVIGNYDQIGLIDNSTAIYAVGTFRVQDETDENKQPNFNFATMDCTKIRQDGYVANCTLSKAVTWAENNSPNADSPNCELDIDVSNFLMKEISKGVLMGSDVGTSADFVSCFNTMLVIDKNRQRVYLNFTRTAHADDMEKIVANICGKPRQQVLMNCTRWARVRASKKTDETLPSRYCDFSDSNDR